MKIAVFESGSIGGYFGGRLAQAGNDVTFIARGKHLDPIVASGLQVYSISGDFTTHSVKATERVEEVGIVDIVLCGVKSWQVAEVADAIRLLVGPETMIIPIQNGVEAHTVLSGAIGAEHILPGLCKMISMIEAPGRIRHTGVDPYLAFGEVDGRLTPRVQKTAQLFANAQGITVDVYEHIIADLWKKFMLIAPWSGVGALTRSPVVYFAASLKHESCW